MLQTPLLLGLVNWQHWTDGVKEKKDGVLVGVSIHLALTFVAVAGRLHFEPSPRWSAPSLVTISSSYSFRTRVALLLLVPPTPHLPSFPPPSPPACTAISIRLSLLSLLCKLSLYEAPLKLLHLNVLFFVRTLIDMIVGLGMGVHLANQHCLSGTPVPWVGSRLAVVEC